MPRKSDPSRNEPIDADDLRGFRYFKRLTPLLRRLHDHATARDRAHNRTLHYDQYVSLILLHLFSPAVGTLRMIQQSSQVEKVQKVLGCARTSLGSLSEAARVFDPKLLLGIIDELATELKPLGKDPRHGDIRQVVTLVDGSLLKTLPSIAGAMWLKTAAGTDHAAWRLHAHFDLDHFVPSRVELTDARNSGKSEEKAVLRKALAPDHCYVMDRGYAQFALFNSIAAVGSSYVCRVRDNSVYTVQSERERSPAAIAASVVSDQVVDLGSTQPGRVRPDHPLRLVIVRVTPHEKRSNRKGNTGAGPSDGLLRIATNLLDVPAEVIALLYQQRFQIELFFRFFKSLLGCRHLISHDPRGVQIQIYCAVIVCLLLNLYTGRRPDKRTLEMAFWFMSGIATEAEWLAHINKPDNRGVKLRAKDELWKKLGY